MDINDFNTFNHITIGAVDYAASCEDDLVTCFASPADKSVFGYSGANIYQAEATEEALRGEDPISGTLRHYITKDVERENFDPEKDPSYTKYKLAKVLESEKQGVELPRDMVAVMRLELIIAIEGQVNLKPVE